MSNGRSVPRLSAPAQSYLLSMQPSDNTPGRMTPSLLLAPSRPPDPLALFTPDDDAEVDSFVGQATMSTNPSLYSAFGQQGSETDPFAHVTQPSELDASRYGVRPQSYAPQVGDLSYIRGSPTSQGPNHQRLPMGYSATSENTVNFQAEQQASHATVNPYRITGKSSYPPVAASQPQYGNTSQAATTAPSSYQPTTTSLPNPIQNYGTPNPLHSIHPPQPASEANAYRPIQHHWFYQDASAPKETWRAFSHLDSAKLEEVVRSNGSTSNTPVVSVEGGRYDVDVVRRERSAIYWREMSTRVRRCSWFYRAHGDNRFLPYEEQFAVWLEESYKTTLVTGDYHKRIECGTTETIVIHSPQVILHFSGATELDAWGNSTSEARPRVVKRAAAEVADIPVDEPLHSVDHLVLVVPGLDPTALEPKYRSLVDLVNDMRGVSNEMLRAHFSGSTAGRGGGVVGWVEYLPVDWQDAVIDDVAEVHGRIKSVTLRSIAKLRGFSNDALLGVMVYGSAMYAQRMVNAVGAELCRLRALFASRNQGFAGGVSLVGHGLGAVILFDILLHQQDPKCLPSDQRKESVQAPSTNRVVSEGSTDGTEGLAAVLSQLGLLSYRELFEREHIDLDTLSLLDDADVKNLELPLGPRKKLQEYVKNSAEQRKNEPDALCSGEKELELTTASQINTLSKTSSTNYVCHGAGIGVPAIAYPRIDFAPTMLFALSSPLAMLLAVRGTANLGEEFSLPTCPGFYNIFHPFDPVAYRMEPLILGAAGTCPEKSLLVPHHKGRKRLHLELRESLARVGSDLKQRFIESVRSTWRSINSFAMSHRRSSTGEDSTGNDAESPEYPETEVVDSVLCELTGIRDEAVGMAGGATESVASESVTGEEVYVGKINGGRRVDYVLQEKPIEMLNDYLFALGSQSCYWLSEDTLLMMLKEIYILRGITAVSKSGPMYSSVGMFSHAAPVGPPPQSGFVLSGSAAATVLPPHPFDQEAARRGWVPSGSSTTAMTAVVGLNPPQQAGYPQVYPQGFPQHGIPQQGISQQGSNYEEARSVDATRREGDMEGRGVSLTSRMGPPLAKPASSVPQGLVRPFTLNSAQVQVLAMQGQGPPSAQAPVAMQAPLAAPAPLPTEFIRK